MALNIKYIGKPSVEIPADGTEGYGSITLSIQDQSQEIKTMKTIAYIVKNDENLQKYLNINYPHGYDKSKSQDLKIYYMYFYCSQSDLKNKIQDFQVVVHRFNKSKKLKDCKIQKEQFKQKCITEKTPHLFLANTCHKELTTTDFMKFLGDHSISVTVKSLCEGNYKGVQVHGKHPESVGFKVKTNIDCDLYIEEAGVFDKLVDGPLLYEDGQDNWNLMGRYMKDLRCKRIAVHHLAYPGE